MDLSAWRQRTYAANVANAGTPEYRRRDVKFADELKSAGSRSVHLAVTHEGHMGSAGNAGPGVEVYEVPPEEGPDSVEIEKEMVSLAENQLRFNLAARLASLRIQGLRASIRGR
jgi:flagellar basal-body rod protein FlgB